MNDIERRSFARRCCTPALALLLFAEVLGLSKTATAQAWMDTALTAQQRAQLLLATMTAAEKITLVHGTAGMAQPPVVVSPGGIYTFRSSAAADLCIDVKGAGSANGTVVQGYTCNGTGAQIFTAQDLGGGQIKLVNASSGRCVDPAGASTANQTPMVIIDCGITATQGFTLGNMDAGTSSLVNAASGRCLGFAAGVAAIETPLQLLDCDGSLTQQFVPVEPQYVGNVPTIARLGIPAIRLQDGPAGVAGGPNLVTAFPAPITVGASWDEDLAKKYGEAEAKEEAGKGANVQLGPMMNMVRIPHAGRNFEGFSEDPFLASHMAAAVVRGIQSQGIIATAKHYIDNEQETLRSSVSISIDDRTQHEIYLPVFQASVEAGVGAVMCSYNRINGIYACENGPTQNGWLKGELGFRGFIMSDWGATHSTVASALAGLDMEMPGGGYFGDALARAVSSGAVPQSRVDDMVLRILTSMFQAGLLDRAPSGNLGSKVTSDASMALARTAAASGTVLLKNDGALLPFSAAKVKSIAVIGNAADTAPVAQGGGSAYVRAPYITTPRAGITARAGTSMTVQYAPSTVAAAQLAASTSDVAVVVVGVSSSEGADRVSLSLGPGDDALITAVTTANPRTVVVVYAPAQVLMPWASQAAAILYGFLPGQEEGSALADILFGDVNPSAKLPMTIAAKDTDYPTSVAPRFPGVDGISMYSDGALVGYRYFDQKKIAPLFAFGHGLSYASFEYANPTVTTGSAGEIVVGFDLTNTSGVAGAEVAQAYVGLPVETSEPPSQLRAFAKVQLAAGETKKVNLTIPERAYSFYSAGRARWISYPGKHIIAVGSSSRDIRLSAEFELTGGPFSGTVGQAEEGTLEGGAAVSSAAAGFTGTGYVSGISAPGAKVSFAVQAPEAARLPVTVRYSTVQAPQTLSVLVNGAKVAQCRFANLANSDTWDFATDYLWLERGANTITFACDQGDTCHVDLDAVIVGAADVPRDGGADRSIDGGAGGAGGVVITAVDASTTEAGAVDASHDGAPPACAPVPATAPVAEAAGGGCGCIVARSNRGPNALLFTLLAGALAILRRDRRRRGRSAG